MGKGTFIENVQRNYETFSEYMQRDTKGVELLMYSTSGLLFAFACWKNRPASKFCKGSDIPKSFFRRRIPQYGHVEGIEPHTQNGPLLLVNHKPPLSFLNLNKETLQVQLPGVNINSNGYSWLQTVAVGKPIEFIPVAKNDDAAVCRVLLVCKDNKKQKVDASEALLSLGFAKSATIPENIKDPEWAKYIEQLRKVEDNAKSERRGLWSEILPPKAWPLKISQEKFESLIRHFLPAERRLPELVR